MKEDIKGWIDLYKFMYNYKGTVGTSMVAFTIWYQSGLSGAFLFLGIILMIVGVIAVIAKAVNPWKIIFGIAWDVDGVRLMAAGVLDVGVSARV